MQFNEFTQPFANFMPNFHDLRPMTRRRGSSLRRRGYMFADSRAAALYKTVPREPTANHISTLQSGYSLLLWADSSTGRMCLCRDGEGGQAVGGFGAVRRLWSKLGLASRCSACCLCCRRGPREAKIKRGKATPLPWTKVMWYNIILVHVDLHLRFK